ncbi:conserved Plasmodium protein, unknown function [Plasmodium knowlesi strain H]|uniref:Uncharacterized protein n=3 Tax=Plasmodium knowlesi TaxID=5850 RepID=A0A5K1UN13_PLAKH|nr:conserved Plasmodium protein, unknown function [Plasmodium knowlesi strain H]OTN63848.1 Uncharacterized protein PKNOH_S140231900 [Plasmodium knowlesi]CAA9990741.1 conserved Plasmodium protein, unknown function [Plasmodium knowlesi strain H]SBO21177.1 conserved Plasmodium protein, unknown function [Plasmodium knowlesi strain H]SBO21633.1 conserved Plasmodium protein, unknown function [Plasmodium knowlesi strain H]VVS80215.1 conserved Plasmodium protein, unknown function [Plasmodium knowlesi |eukprot:XP_002262030.1 hypothetical protein, conserved in Plasmodium species [Plasmodium knowlesi strain H]
MERKGKNNCNEGNLKFLKVYSKALFKYTEEEKDKKSREIVLLSEKIESEKKLIKISIEIILIILFFILIYTSNDLVKIKNLENHIYNNINESKTYSENFYKSISDEIKKVNNDFSYQPRKKDYIIFKNLRSKFDLSSWIKNALTQRVSQDNFLNSNVLFGKCWRITMRLYKKDNSMMDNIFMYRKLFGVYPDSSFLGGLEDTRNVNSSYFDTKWSYLFSHYKSYKKIGGLYQVICGEDFSKIEERLSQGTSYSIDYPYFIPALILTNYNIASVAIDFLLFNPLLNVLSYNVLKFSFLPNGDTYKEVVTQSASYNRFDAYFIISLSVFMAIFIVYVIIHLRKFSMVGFTLYVKSYCTSFLLIACFATNLVTLCLFLLSRTQLPKLLVGYENGKYKVDSMRYQTHEDGIIELLHDMNITLSRIELIKNIFVSNTIITFEVCLFVCVKRYGLLIKKYSNVENNIRRDFLHPFFIILCIIFGCLGIFSVFSYTLFHIEENVSSSIVQTFIFNVCIIFANFQGINISSILNEENILSYLYSIPTHFFIVTMSFAFIFFLAIKSFIKRNKNLYNSFMHNYGHKLPKCRTSDKGGMHGRSDHLNAKEMYATSLQKNDAQKAKSSGQDLNDNSTLEITAYSEVEDEMEEEGDHKEEDTGYSIDHLTDGVKKRDKQALSSDDNSTYSQEESNEYEVDPGNYGTNKSLNYNDVMSITKGLNKDKEEGTEKKKTKEKAFFTIEKMLDLFLNLKNSTVLPFSNKEKKRISKEYTTNKKRSEGVVVSLSVYTSLLIFIMLFLINNYKKGRESEKLLHYQIENIGYYPSNGHFSNMTFHYLKKNVNVNVREIFNFQKVENKTDLILWLKTCFASFLDNSSHAMEGGANDLSSTFIWKDIFTLKHERVRINITSRETIQSSNSSLICNYMRKNCYMDIRNESKDLQRGINEVTLLINDAIEKVEISFILFDKNDYHNILVNLHFIFNPSGYISKKIYFDHLFFNSFSIFHLRGVLINILFLTILLCPFISMYLYLFKNFSYFYNACVAVTVRHDRPDAQRGGWLEGQFNAQSGGQVGTADNANGFIYGGYSPWEYNVGDYTQAYNWDAYANNPAAGDTNWGAYGNNPTVGGANYRYYDAVNMPQGALNYGFNYGNMNTPPNRKSGKTHQMDALLKFKVYLTYLFESNVLNLLIQLSSFSIVALWLTVCIYINKIEYNADNSGSYFSEYIKLFSFFSKFVNIFYFFLFLVIINMFIFSSNYVKREKLYEALYVNRRQILKCGFMLLLVYLNFFLFHYFFYGIDGFNDLLTSQQPIYSILLLLGLVNIDVYLKCKVFYFILFVLPHLVFIRFLLMYCFLAPVMASYLIFLKKRGEKKKKKKIASQKGEDYSSFTLTHLSNEQWKYLNEDIKEFAANETNSILHYFENVKDQIRSKEDISKTLKNECNGLKERVHELQLDLRKIELKWKFRSKLLSSSKVYLDKINNQISMSEEMIVEDKNRMSSLKQYAQQMKLDQ